jgi:ribonuclease Y
MFTVAALLIGLLVAAAAAVIALRFLGVSRLGAAYRERDLLLSEASREAETIKREAVIAAGEEVNRLRLEAQREIREQRARITKIEERALAREDDASKRLKELERREQGLSDRETHVRELQDELKSTKDEQLAELERVSGMTVNEARATLLERSEELVKHDLARRVRHLDEEAQTEAKRRARNLVADALQRVAASHAAETTSSLIELPSDDMKGRIIGREGRNIRALEHLTGVDEIVDDIRHAGEQGVFEANCGEFHDEIVKLLGRLHYRTSYGQNVLKHTLEVVHLAGLMATELQANVKTVKRAAVLHDVGKALTHEVEGSHAAISTQYARRYGEAPGVVHAVEAHHYEVQPQTVEAVLLIAADAVSGARPGARGDSLENYIKRLSALEDLAIKKDGVEKAYALQAGREIRVIVKPGEIDDDQAAMLSHEIARDIEQELEYPGQIKVTVIRESRSVEFAK